MAFVFPLFIEAAFGWQRRSRPGLCFLASLIGILVVRNSVQMAPLPFSMGWYLFFVQPGWWSRGKTAGFHNLSETMCTVLALSSAGLARSADKGWIILAAQCATSLFLALGAAVFTALSMAAVISLTLQIQHSEYDGPCSIDFHRRRWMSVCYTWRGRRTLTQTWTNYRISRGMVWLAFILSAPFFPWLHGILCCWASWRLRFHQAFGFLTGRVRWRKQSCSFLSALKGETAQFILILAFGLANPVLVLLLMVLLLNAQDDAVVQISQATYQALVDKLTAIESVTTQQPAKQSSFHDSVVAALDAQAGSVQRACLQDIVSSKDPAFSAAKNSFVRMVTARLLLDAGVGVKFLDAFNTLASARRWSIIVRNCGHALAHVTLPGTSPHVGPTPVSHVPPQEPEMFVES